MSFFQFGGTTALAHGVGFDVEMLRKAECAVCPNNCRRDLLHPKMKPSGAPRALVYVLGEAPGAVEDERGTPFVGKSGKLLKRYLPDELHGRVRFNNVTRCFPGKDGTPGPVEIEACRPSIVRDIEACRPQAIFGFGNIPLNWALQETGITKWAGRRIPVRIGNHTCWYYAFLHPAGILRNQPEYHPGPYSSEDEFAFAFQLKTAVAELTSLPAPKVHSVEEALQGLEIITGSEPNALERIAAHLARLQEEPIAGLDYETNAIRPYTIGAKILSVALAGRERSLAVAWKHKQAEWTEKRFLQLKDMMRRFLRERKCRLVAHQLPFEIEWSAYFFGRKMIWGTKWGDSASQAYILDERPWTLSLDFLVKQYFGLGIKDIHNLDRDHLDDAPLGEVLQYNALDSKYHRLVYLKQEKRLFREQLMTTYQHQLERTIAVVPTQLNGVPIDPEMNQYLHRRYAKKLAKIEGTIASHSQAQTYKNRTGQAFRPSSLDDVRRFLFAVLELVEFKDKSRQVDEAALAQIDNPIIGFVRRWRKVNKILSTYILPVQADSKHVYSDGCLHPIISTTKTRTWRTSSEDPNTQNWPMRDPVAKEARQQVHGGDDHCIVAFDYSGIQARNVAMESRDPRLVQYFHERYDIHTDWMQRLAKLDPRWIPGGLQAAEKDKALLTKHRYQAKNKFVFPSFFGARPKSIARSLGVEISIADKLQRAFWREFPEVKGWQERLVKSYYRLGYVTGLSGFRRRAPVVHNELINSPIQSDESIIVCDAMVRVSKLDLPCTMEIHDDLTFIWPRHKIDEYAELVIAEMLRIRFDWINVPLEIEMSVGEDWGSMEKTGKFESVGKNEWRELPK